MGPTTPIVIVVAVRRRARAAPRCRAPVRNDGATPPAEEEGERGGATPRRRALEWMETGGAAPPTWAALCRRVLEWMEMGGAALPVWAVPCRRVRERKERAAAAPRRRAPECMERGGAAPPAWAAPCRCALEWMERGGPRRHRFCRRGGDGGGALGEALWPSLSLDHGLVLLS